MQAERANAIWNSLKEEKKSFHWHAALLLFDYFVLSSISLHEKPLFMHDKMEAKNNQSLFQFHANIHRWISNDLW